jgi:hypothetical protein
VHPSPADLLIADLDAGGSALLDELVGLRGEGLLADRVVDYYSHVDTALGQAAEAAGVQAMARGQFWSSLSEVLGS